MLPASINKNISPINIPPSEQTTKINHPFVKTKVFESIQKLTILMNEDRGINAIMNCDEYHLPIKHKDPTKLCEKIIENISSLSKEWGCSQEEVENMFGYVNGFREPVCGLFANNIMKLFLDKNEEAFDKKNHNPISELPSIINILPENKNFILRIQDKALGHTYVIDIPSGKNDSRQCFCTKPTSGKALLVKLAQ